MIAEIMLIVCSIWSLLCGVLLIAIYINNKRDKKRVKGNTKEENLKSPCYQKTSCLDCKIYDKENYYCPRFCEVIRDAVKDAKQKEGVSMDNEITTGNMSNEERPQSEFVKLLNERIEKGVCKWCQMNKHCELCEISRVFMIIALTDEEMKGGAKG